MNQKTPLSVRRRIAFAVAATVLMWLCVELLILVNLWWVLWTDAAEYPYLYRPHPHRAFAPVPNGVDRARRMSFNSSGLRGPEVAMEKPADTVRIVCLGGSTTFSDGASTDSATYPARMERLLRERYRNAPFRIEVINAGVDCYNSLESLIYFQTRLLDFSPDIAISHQGINDMWFMLAARGFRSDLTHARRTFAVPPRKWWQYSPFLSCCFARNTLNNPYYPARVVNLNLLIVTDPGMFENPENAPGVELEPEMAATFERNTRSFVSIARGNGIIPVVSTQALQDSPGGGGRWTRAMERVNRVTRDVVASESVGLIDLAQLMPWNPVDYYDNCHLKDTPGGLGRQAQIFADGLIAMRAVERTWEGRQEQKSEARGRK